LLRLLIFLFPLSLSAQDTLPFFNPAHNIELGINATATLSTFVGNETSGITAADYPLSVKLLRKPTQGWRLGLGIDVETETSDGVGSGIVTETEALQFFGRIGYEWRKILSRRWMFYVGVDILGSIATDNGNASTPNGFSRLELTQWGTGGGPAYGLQFAITPRLHVGTEGSIYATFRYSERREVFEFDPSLNNSQTTREWDLRTSVPQWLYLTVRL